MNYLTIDTNEKPTEAPAQFTVFQFGPEQYVFCPVRSRAYKVDGKPEEIVRQWWLYRLRDVYGYAFNQMGVEVSVPVGSTEAKKAADIVVYVDPGKKTPRFFVEVKKPNRKDGIEQLKVYMNATGCRIGLWSNGDPPHVYLLRMEPTADEEQANWRELRDVPKKTQELADVDTPIIRAELAPVTDFLSVMRECENYIKAHEGADVFQEVFKLIFAKLYDERKNLKNDQSPTTFRVGAFENAADAKARIRKLFKAAKEHWRGVFDEGEDILLSDESLAFSVSALQKSYLLRSDADILGSAFEVMINPSMKGDKGQYFTPRHVVRMCIDVLNPQENESIFDPACGSGGFLVSAMDHVYAKIRSDRDDESEILENQKDYASNNVFGIDFDRNIAKVAKAYMLIWGDGRSNISVEDGLNETGWDQANLVKYIVGAGKSAKLRQFNIIATNPPFAGDISSEETLSKYYLAYKQASNGRKRRATKVAKDKLFVERSLNMLAPGGRMAIVLPRGTLKNYSDEDVRRFILMRARIAAVVSLTGTMFKPYTNTKTCVLFLQKRMKELSDINEALNDPQIVFAVSERPGKDKSGNLIHLEDGRVDSDLEEIAENIKAAGIWI
ncbi:N-6 DNA methylase [Rhizobium sp. BT-226]|uniref:restriction endonuclease subunit M n=1 Tax=Rhizobium sp. BT-226 TaxID=2986922 RepID=UPI0021F6F17A|nr:N-6 DNA methylase [Rhizobium sp. BT-226]MCW0017495.1 N-6 DNA methylase [Rhizobium sp. BT-226]